jgi:hypothetical protein
VSEFRDAIADVVADRETGTGEACRLLSTGIRFLAEIEEIQDKELNTELGRDPRESVLMHVRDANATAVIRLGQEIEISLYGQLAKFKALRRKNNPASPQVEFGLMKLTDKDT